MDILREITQRFSVRRFAPVPLPKAAVERILEAGRLAPSAKNRQPWRFIAVEDPNKKRRIEAASFGQEHVGDAGAVIIGCSTNVDYRMPNGQLSYPIDIAIAAAYMDLQAVHEGFGTCLVSTFDEQQVKDIITAPHLMRVVLLLAVGVSAEGPRPRERLPLSRVSAFEHW